MDAASAWLAITRGPAGLPIATCIVAVVALLVAEWRGSLRGVWIAKPLASGCFLWAAVALGATATGYGRLVLLGLGLCACGDVLLIPRESARAFQAGIAAFLLGHVAYAAGFLLLDPSGAAAGAAAVAMVAFAWVVLRWLGPRVPADLRVPVRAYVVVISAMVTCSIGAAAGGGPPAVAAGAIAFALSDLSVARDRFVSPGFANAAWGLPLYYAAQLVLAGSV